MLYARNQSGSRIEATPGSPGICPHCENRLIAKCGQIKTWHWSHLAAPDCYSWSEGETEWHLDWKKIVRPECSEVTIGPHRADIVGNGGIVIELQNSPISSECIRERESFYRKMIWIVNAEQFKENLDIRVSRRNNSPDYRTFRWKHLRRSWAFAKMPVFWDFGHSDRIFKVGKVHDGTPCGGWGTWVSSNDFGMAYLLEVVRK